MEARSIKYKLTIILFFVVNVFLVFFDKTRHFYIWILLSFFVLNLFLRTVFFIFSLLVLDKKYDLNKLKKLDNSDLPIYSVLIPVFKEDFNVIRNLLNSIYNFDYDLNKLDIIILLEEDDADTLNNIKKLKNIFNFTYLIVPNSNVRTKPHALNYGLKYIKGKYLVVYDAEDIPEPYQLKKTVYEFSNLPDEYFCLQARLNYYNKNENILTKCFSIEYSLWFNYFIKSFSEHFNFFAIGGTSNHFKVDKLKDIDGWDAYNVTEDAEISVRAIANGYKIKTLNSETLEESVKDLRSWFQQRRRWIKGYMQTYLQYITHPINLFKNVGCKNFLLFNYIIGFSFITPILYLFFLITYIFHSNNFSLNQLFVNTFIYHFYIYSTFAMVVIFARTNGKITFKSVKDIVCYILYSHIYTIAVYFTVIELFKRPFSWNKTMHNKSIYNWIYTL